MEPVDPFSSNGHIVFHVRFKIRKIKKKFVKPVVFVEYICNYDVSRENYCNCFLLYELPAGLTLILKLNNPIVGSILYGVY